MYYQYFGLDRPPFKITPDTDFFFSGGNRGAVLDALTYAVTHGEGTVKVTGEVGSGKTMLCRMLQSRLPSHIEQVYIANPSVSPEEILRALAFELGLTVPRDVSRIELMHALQDHLVLRHSEGRQVVAFVEESQSMPVATLEEIRLLSNLETKHHKLLQIVLFGQPELDEILAQPNIRQLRERIAHSFSLQPLQAEEVREYLAFRLRAAGYRGPDLFAPKLVRHIADTTGGLSRRVNLVADKALLAAFADNTHTLSLAHVQAAVRDSEFRAKHVFGGSRSWLRAAGLLGLGAAIGIGAFWWLEVLRGSSATVGARKESGPATALPHTIPDTTLSEVSAPGIQVTRESKTSPAASSVTAEAPTAAPIGSDTATAKKSPGGAAAAGSSDDLLAARLNATRDWLRKTDNRGLTIQLILAGDDTGELKRYLGTLGKFIETDQLYVYRTRVQDKSYFGVLYGEFPTRQAAQIALRKLPEAVTADRPYVRPKASIKDESLQTR